MYGQNKYPRVLHRPKDKDYKENGTQEIPKYYSTYYRNK
jgi:hypothetical protein